VIPVTAGTLHNFRTEQPARRSRSLFPFFERGGAVRWVMLVDDGSDAIRLLRWQPGQFRVDWRRRVQSPADRELGLALGDPAGAAVLDHLWHYDPWWVLTADRYRGNGAVPFLKSTNCIDRLPADFTSLTFRDDLGAVNGVLLRRKSRWTRQRWDPSWLPRAPAVSVPPPRQTGWVFDPLWVRR
jgi:hypothetical protein